MPRKSSKTSESISALQRRSSRVALPAAPTSTTSAPISLSASASASPAPSPSTIIPLSVPIANAKNIDDINWRHPAELQLIHPTASSQADIIPILLRQAFSVPPQPTDPNEKFCTITLGVGLDAERVQVVVPLGYRIPLLFCGKYLWESVRLVLTSVDPPPQEEWEQYKYDLLNLSRLCYLFLESALLVTMSRKGKGMKKGWRSKMFDRVLTRYFWGWLVNREEYIRAFWFEFKEEEYERDVCRRDWKTMVLTGHKGFHLTPSEIANGITAEQFTAGLLSIPPQLSSSSSSAGITYKWDNTLYALANELVITGSRVRERSELEEGEGAGKEGQGLEQEGWEGDEGRRRKRMKIDVDPADAEEVAFDLVHGARNGDGDEGDGDIDMLDQTVVGEVLPAPPASAQRSPSPQFPTSNLRESTMTADEGGDDEEDEDESLSAIASALALPTLDAEPSRSNAASPRPGGGLNSSSGLGGQKGVGGTSARVDGGSANVAGVSRRTDTPAEVSEERQIVPLEKRAENVLVADGSVPPPPSGSTPTAVSPTEKPAPPSSSTPSPSQLALIPAPSTSIQPPTSIIPTSSAPSLPPSFRPSNPEVITQVLELVPNMLSQLRTIIDVAHSEKTLLSSSAADSERQGALEKMQGATASLSSSSTSLNSTALSAPSPSSSSVSVELMNSLVERIKALESDVQSDRDRRAQQNLEWNQLSRKIGELEERVRGYESLSPSALSPSSGGAVTVAVNGSNGHGAPVNGNANAHAIPERYRTPLSRTSSIDESCPLPVKSKRKMNLNLIALSESGSGSPRPS